MPTRKKILFFITSLADGGAERALINLLKALDKTKYDITLRVICAGGPRENAIPAGVTYKPIIRTKIEILKKILRKAVMCPVFSKLIYRFFIADNYETEVAYMQGIPTYILQSMEKKGKTIAYIHTAISREFVENVLKIYKSKERVHEYYSKMDKVIFVSEGSKNEFEAFFGSISNSCVAHNVVDVDSILLDSTKRIDIPYRDDQINIVTCGRLVPVKGIDRILESVKNMEIDSSNYKIYIIGSGSEEEKYRKYIRDNHLENINMLAYRDNVFPLIKNADMYISASISESFGMSIVEALIIGVPILTTNIPSLRDLLNKKYEGGVMVVDNSFEGLRNGLEKFLSNDELRAQMTKDAKSNAVYYRTKFAKYYDENERLL